MSRRKRRARAQDAYTNDLARMGANNLNLLETTQYPLQRLSYNYMLLQSLYRSHWIVRRIIDTLPEDMCKKWVKLDTQVTPDQIKDFDKVVRQTQVVSRMIDGLRWGRLFGGAVALILIEGHEEYLHVPLDVDMIMPGAFCGLLIRDRWSGVSPTGELITDLRDPDFGLPEYYNLTTEEATYKVHHSRILRFIGRDVPMWEKQAEMQWGVSEVEHIYDELRKRDNTSWNIANLVFRSYLIALKMQDLGQALAIGDQQAKQDLYNVVSAQNQMMSSQGMLLMDKDDELDTKSYTFSGLSDIQENFMLDVAGAAEIPVTKLFGRSPAGMNATGESDMNNYYDSISQKQSTYLEPVLDKLFPIIAMSTWGYIPDDLDYTFNPVDTMTNKDRIDMADKGGEAIGKQYDRGLISQKTALKELRQQSETTGVFSNITDEDIANAKAEVEQPDPMAGMGGMAPPDDQQVDPQQQDPTFAEKQQQDDLDLLKKDYINR